MKNTDFKGELAQLKVEMRAIEKGFYVSRPTTNCRYDLIIDNGSLHRVQVKYADRCQRDDGKSVIVNLRYRDRAGVENTYKKGETDWLAAYVPRVDKVFMFSPDMFCDKTSVTIRISDRHPNSLWWEDYVW